MWFANNNITAEIFCDDDLYNQSAWFLSLLSQYRNNALDDSELPEVRTSLNFTKYEETDSESPVWHIYTSLNHPEYEETWKQEMYRRLKRPNRMYVVYQPFGDCLCDFKDNVTHPARNAAEYPIDDLLYSSNMNFNANLGWQRMGLNINSCLRPNVAFDDDADDIEIRKKYGRNEQNTSFSNMLTPAYHTRSVSNIFKPASIYEPPAFKSFPINSRKEPPAFKSFPINSRKRKKSEDDNILLGDDSGNIAANDDGEPIITEQNIADLRTNGITTVYLGKNFENLSRTECDKL
jgi:hypothetical protein